MIEELLAERAADNLVETYLAVGSEGEGAKIDRFDEGVCCTSNLAHASSNFAIVRKQGPNVRRKVLPLARSRSSFNVYAIPGSHQDEIACTLENEGFVVAGRLAMMIGDNSKAKPCEGMRDCASFEDRIEATRFMARQFFPRQTSSLRESIALATAKAQGQIFGIGPREPKAAAMVFRTAAMFGIYNVCVAPKERERGYGSVLVEGLLALAARENTLATLQCDPSLEPWYSRRGFKSIGMILVYTLDQKLYHAIM